MRVVGGSSLVVVLLLLLVVAVVEVVGFLGPMVVRLLLMKMKIERE